MKSILSCFVIGSLTSIFLTSCYTRLALTSAVEPAQSEDNIYPVSVVYNPPVIIAPPPSSDVSAPVVSPVQQRPFEQDGSIKIQDHGSKRVPVNGKDRPRKSKILHPKLSSPKQYGSRIGK